jgi:putative GTP pyrophosphokinase
MDEINPRLLVEYDSNKELHSLFTRTVENLLVELVREDGIRIHSITSRVKDRVSFHRKILRAQGKYSKLNEITDVCGLRVITYFAEDVDTVAKVIEEEFDVDRDNSVDKRAVLDPDRFGYLSLHYVVKLPSSRIHLTEYKRFEKCQAEIQIRSIIQHAWAEIEHDLGYKNERVIPRDIRRSFFRLAAMLEMGDGEFSRLRGHLEEYKRNVEEKLSLSSGEILIDNASLSVFVLNDIRVNSIDQQLASLFNSKISFSQDFITSTVLELRSLGLKTLNDIEAELEELTPHICPFAELWAPRSQGDGLPVGISLFYLSYLIAAKTGDVRLLAQYFDENNIGHSNEREKLAVKILETIKKAKIGG